MEKLSNIFSMFTNTGADLELDDIFIIIFVSLVILALLLGYLLGRKVTGKEKKKIKAAKKMAEVQMSHMEDMAARMREESQFAQRMQSEQAAKQAGLASESEYINAHSINKQAEVLKAGMENMGQMGAMNMGGGADGHMNPAGMMTGMMMGAAVGGQAANMMNQMGQTMQQNMANAGKPMQGPPPNQQQVSYFLAINGQQYGPCDANAVAQMVASNQINGETLGWCNGMSGWEPIKQIPGLASIFAQPSMPGCPPPIPTK